MNSSYVNFTGIDNQAEAALKALPADASLQDKVITVLRHIYDPEIPVNIYDLGLIYRLDIQGKDVNIKMTLTTPNCPVADAMPAQVESAVRKIDGIGEVEVRLTWDPPWDMSQLSDEVRLTLGLL